MRRTRHEWEALAAVTAGYVERGLGIIRGYNLAAYGDEDPDPEPDDTLDFWRGWVSYAEIMTIDGCATDLDAYNAGIVARELWLAIVEGEE